MGLYVGYPISYETACGFLCIPTETEETTFDRLMKATDLDFLYVDKGQYILGLQVDTGNLFDRFVDVDSGLMHILEMKKKVTELIKKSSIDLSDFMIQPIGHEAFMRVFNPEPYLLSF